MVEEIRTYLLNDKSFSGVVYIDKDYIPRSLNKTFSEFRKCLLLDSGNDTSKAVQAWRINLFVNAIYKDRDLSKIALKNFDKRVIKDKNITNLDFLPKVKQSIYDDRILIKSGVQNFPHDGIYDKLVILKKISNNSVNVSFSHNNLSYGNSHNLIFIFKNRSSNMIDIPDTRLKIGFSDSSSVPFNDLTIETQYPYSLNINNTIDKIYQIPGLDELIWINKQAFSELFDLYSKTDRSYKKILCLILGYAISLKWQ